MQKSYVKQYAEHFKLYRRENSYYNERGDLVLSILNEQIFCRQNNVDWKPCKQGDLIVSIINNIPLHCQ